jgi:hypothetical protein
MQTLDSFDSQRVRLASCSTYLPGTTPFQPKLHQRSFFEQVLALINSPGVSTSWQHSAAAKRGPAPSAGGGKENAGVAPPQHSLAHHLSPTQFAALQQQSPASMLQGSWQPGEAAARWAPTPAPMTAPPGGMSYNQAAGAQLARTPSPVAGVVELGGPAGRPPPGGMATPLSAQPPLPPAGRSASRGSRESAHGGVVESLHMALRALGEPGMCIAAHTITDGMCMQS